MWTRICNLMVLASLATSCGGAMVGPRTGPAAFHARSAEIEGTLVEVRHYYETGAIGGDHTFCAFLSALDEIPVGVLRKDGTLVMLTGRPSSVAAHVTQAVRVRGKLTANGQLLVPRSMRVKTGSDWTAVEL